MPIDVIVCKNEEVVAQTASEKIAQILRENSHPVLGLATGSTPIKTYQEFIQKILEDPALQKKLKNLATVNLDEYVGISKENSQSYRSFMNANLFNALSEMGLNLDNTHIPNGNAKDLDAECERFEKFVQENNPDLWLLGIGENGHIGFNEPQTSFDSETHVVDLTKNTIKANSRFFEKGEFQPGQAITTGISTIFRAKAILLLATGKNKAEIIKRTLEGDVSSDCPASFLQNHLNATFILDKDAASF